MKRLLSSVPLAFLLATVVGPMARAQMGPPAGKHKFISEGGVARIPFEAEGGHIILDAVINETATLRLLLDTGFSGNGVLLFGSRDTGKWNLNVVAQVLLGGPGEAEPTPADLAEDVSLAFPGLGLTELTAIIEPPNPLMAGLMGSEDGIIGPELFGKFAVTIDQVKRELVVTEPDRYQPPPGAQELPIQLKFNIPWLKCSAEMTDGTMVPLELVVDYGAYHAISLNAGTQPGLVPPPNSIEAHLGTTVTGPIHGRVGRIKALHLGDFSLKNVVAAFQTGPRHGPSQMEKEGNLGFGVLSRFDVTFDYPSSRIFLLPNRHFSDPFEYNMSGFEISRSPGKAPEITRVLPGSPADDAGLKVGETLVKMNGREASTITRGEMRDLLRKEGSKVRLLVRSGDDAVRKVTITLRRIV